MTSNRFSFATDWPAPGWAVHDVAQDLTLRVTRDMPALPADLDAEIDRIWELWQRRLNGSLFNGRVFAADHQSPHQLCGHWTEFRRIAAQIERPDLFETMKIRPTATGGLLTCADGVVFGRRPENAVYQAAKWQLPPAGSIDPGAGCGDGFVDIMAQMFAELAEELGLNASAIERSALLCLVEHADSHVLDLGVALWTSLDEHAIRSAHAERGNNEYSNLMVVPQSALTAFVENLGDELTPQARVFLCRAGYLGASGFDDLTGNR